MASSRIRIVTPSRIHACLIDMNGELGRVDGGIGFSIDRPNWEIVFERNDKEEIILELGDETIRPVALEIIDSLINALGIDDNRKGITISIERTVPSHVGLGSKTQLCLALADGISRLVGHSDVTASREMLARLVRRGGTSGIGVTAYHSGGVIIDGGHGFGNGREKTSFLPSSASNAGPPPVLFHAHFPGDWRAVVGLPSFQEQGAHDQEEVNVFARCCPIPAVEVERLSRLVLMKFMPAVLEGDIDAVSECIDSFQSIGFKKREVELQGPAMRETFDTWKDCGARCVGMSSFGPTIYSIAASEREARQLANNITACYGNRMKVFVASFCKEGAKVIQEP